MMVATLVFLAGATSVLLTVAFMIASPYKVVGSTSGAVDSGLVRESMDIGDAASTGVIKVTPELIEEMGGLDALDTGTSDGVLNPVTALLVNGMIAVILVTIVAGILAAVLSGRIARPLQRVTQVARTIEQGDLSVRVASAHDEAEKKRP